MEKRRRPRALTLTLPDAQQPFLILFGRKYTLRNFSEEGIGLWVQPPLPFGLSVGATVSGDVEIEQNIYPVKLEVMHVSNKVVGLKIAHKSPELTKLFQRLLQPALYAANLQPHPLSGSEDPTSGHSRLWYIGSAGVELIAWYNALQKMLMAVQLCWLGRWVYRCQFKPPETGYMFDDGCANGGLLGIDQLVIRHAEPDSVLLQQAAEFLTSTSPPLPGHLLWQFLETGEQIYLPTEIIRSEIVA
ncbi:MAG: hypothetical protein HY537_12440 [Deltaproteobacteria bacterium]|nr:hypothetical protein [Deltaproteobacteria bacterium]